MRGRRFPGHPGLAAVGAAVLTVLGVAGGCGRAPIPDDGPANAVCTPYRPSAAAWSSLAMSRPPVMTAPVPSPDGDYIYAVGTWIDGGTMTSQVVRSGDLGDSWCVLAAEAEIADVIPAPADASVLYAIANSSYPFLLRSLDAGTTWSYRGGMPPGIVGFDSSGIVVASTDPAIIWLTKAAADTLSFSREGGTTWTQSKLPSTLTVNDGSVISVVDNVVVDRASPNRVLVSGASGDITMPTDKWTRQTFITEDWGVTWNAVDLPPRASIEIGQTAILVDDAATIYVPTDTQILWRSTDWGRSWKKGADFAARRLAGLTTLGSHRPGELFVWPWRTLDGGASWHDLPIPQVPAFEPALAAGNGKLLGLTGTGFMTSTNAGATWRSSPVGPDAGNRSILEFLVQSPVEPRPLWTGGFFESTTASVYPALRSVDGGLTWTPINTAGGVFLWDGASADVAFSLPGEDIQRTEDGGLTWQTVTLPGASYRVLAAGACAPPLSCLYGLFMDEGNGEITTARTDDHGDTWTPPQLIPRSLGFVGFPGPLTVFPHDPQRLLVPCDRRLCESQDGGATWMYSALPGVSVEFLENGAILSATGGISRSDDDGGTWTPVLNAAGTLVPSRTHPDTVFLIPDPTLPRVSPLMRSDDAGSTWRSAVPDGASTWTVVAVADAPDGRFLALLMNYGLVAFD